MNDRSSGWHNEAYNRSNREWNNHRNDVGSISSYDWEFIEGCLTIILRAMSDNQIPSNDRQIWYDLETEMRMITRTQVTNYYDATPEGEYIAGLIDLLPESLGRVYPPVGELLERVEERQRAVRHFRPPYSRE